MEILKPNKNNLKNIITALKNGAVLVCPTDTVYGLICDAANEKAVEKIFKIKKRGKSQTLPVFIKDISTAKELAEISLGQEEILKRHWPGKATFVLKIKTRPGNTEQFHRIVPLAIGRNSTIALRVPKHEFLNNLLDEFGAPLAQTSANISGQGATTEISQIISIFRGQDIIVINEGDLPASKPSKIIDLTQGEKVIRE